MQNPTEKLSPTEDRSSALAVASGSPSEKIVGTGFYRDAKPGTFGRSEWLDLLLACQDGRATCLRVLEIIEREMDMQQPSADEMANRFLCWRLPATFSPDGGVTFDGKGRDPNSHWWPVGTNLLTAIEAKQMFEHCLANTQISVPVDEKKT